MSSRPPEEEDPTLPTLSDSAVSVFQPVWDACRRGTTSPNCISRDAIKLATSLIQDQKQKPISVEEAMVMVYFVSSIRYAKIRPTAPVITLLQTIERRIKTSPLEAGTPPLTGILELLPPVVENPR